MALRPARSERGSALILALLALFLLSLLGLSILGMSNTEFNIARNWKDYSATFYAAEAGLEAASMGLRTLLADGPSPTTSQLAALTSSPPTLTDTTLTFATYTVAADGGLTVPYQTTIASGAWTGLSGLLMPYRVTSAVTGPGGTRSNLYQVVEHLQVPLFQFGVFYGRGVDLEIAPGPTMTFNGRVHSNSNIYVGAGSTLNFDSYMTTSGHIYRKLKRDSATYPWGNNPRIKDAGGTYRDLNFDYDYDVGFGSTWSPTQWRDQATSTFGGTVKDAVHGITEITPPVPELFQNPTNPDVVAHKLIEMPQVGDSTALAAAKLYSKAGLRIVDGVATDQNGSPVSLPAGAVTTKTFFDARENRSMTVDQVDIDLLRTNGALPANGLVWVGSVDTTRGVRLANGSQLPSSGLTVVSHNPVYVLGNYNTVGKSVGSGPPAAILADAITVLSQAWANSLADSTPANRYDNKGNLTTDNRPANAYGVSSTTVNAAFGLGPSAESVVGQGNGQLENSIRFLENWSGVPINYNGSIVALWHSQNVTGPWRCCGNGTDSGTGLPHYYRAPNRNWGFDTLFLTNPPPGTPMGVVINKGRWARQ
jgi:Tfp pilus assembly protein PilX